MAFKLPALPSVHSLMSSLGVGNLLTQIPFMHSPQSQPASSVAQTAFAHAPSCPVDGPLSCHSGSTKQTCCYITPGGLLLQTQFWDTSPATGPADSWTVHGLWPDLCDGTYDQFCTSAPQYHNITQILETAGQSELLGFMEAYWVPDQGTTEHFWQHEWNKHGTCINTLAPSCYGDEYSPGMEVIDFFSRTVELFKTLDTYAALADANIVPSTQVTYTEREIQDALTRVTGAAVVVGCRGGQLNQAWYSYNVQGSLQTGRFVPTEPPGSGRSSCPKKGIRYLPKE